MATENTVLMKIAKEELTGKWGLAIGTFLVYTLIMGSLALCKKLLVDR